MESVLGLSSFGSIFDLKCRFLPNVAISTEARPLYAELRNCGFFAIQVVNSTKVE